MSKIFYDHLILIDDVVVELDRHEIPSADRQQFLESLDEVLHHHILDTVLLFLPREHHEYFLDRLALEPHHERLLDFVKEKTKVDIENEIKHTVEYVKKKVLKDIEESLE